MEMITRQVSDLPAGARAAFEHMLGHSLQEHQQIIVAVLPDDPATLGREATRARLLETLQEASQHSQAAGITSSEADEAIAEAMAAARPAYSSR